MINLKHVLTLALAFALSFGLSSFIEYGGVHVKFEVHYNDGTQRIGYKYIAHGNSSQVYKDYLNQHPEVLLHNQFTYEPGQFSYYSKRLHYDYQETKLYKLINPIEIDTSKLKMLDILEMKNSSYDIQLVGDYKVEDQVWMTTLPITQFSTSEDLCTYQHFVHSNTLIEAELLNQLKSLIKSYDNIIEKRVSTFKDQINSENEYDSIMKPIYKKRKTDLNELIDKIPSLKIVTVSMCTC